MNNGNNFHDPAALDGTWKAPLMARRDTFDHTFTTPGVYQFICLQHFLQGMRGTVTVEPP